MDLDIGSVIARLRKERSMTLQTLAQRSGLSKGYLSKVENGLKTPPVSTLSRIARSLGVEMADLFERPANESKIMIVRASERRQVSRDGSAYGYNYEAVAHTFGRKMMEPFILTFIPRPRKLRNVVHDGEELIFVLEGVMQFFFGDEVFVCHPGDCLYFDASVPHRGECLGDREAKVLMVITSDRSGS